MRIIVPIPGDFEGVILKEGDIVREDLRIARKHRRSAKTTKSAKIPSRAALINWD
jgi:hypothetical protein